MLDCIIEARKTWLPITWEATPPANLHLETSNFHIYTHNKRSSPLCFVVQSWKGDVSHLKGGCQAALGSDERRNVNVVCANVVQVESTRTPTRTRMD